MEFSPVEFTCPLPRATQAALELLWRVAEYMEKSGATEAPLAEVLCGGADFWVSVAIDLNLIEEVDDSSESSVVPTSGGWALYWSDEDDRLDSESATWTIAEIASYTKSSQRKIRGLVALRAIPFVRIGRRVRLDLKILERWMDLGRPLVPTLTPFKRV